MPQLRVNGRNTYRFAPEDGPTSIGRSSRNNVVLTAKTVSRRHCVIEWQAGTIRLRDLESHYGTKVNGAAVRNALLADGDEIEIGPYTLTFVKSDDTNGLDTAPTQRGGRNGSTEIDGGDDGDDARTALVEERKAIETLRRALMAQQEDACNKAEEKGRAAARALAEELERTKDAVRKQAAHAAEELAAHERRLGDALESGAKLREQIGRLQAEAAHAARRAERAEATLARFAATIHDVYSARLELTTTQSNLRSIEALWIEADEQVSEVERGESADIGQEARRDVIAMKLEEANEARESALDHLLGAIDRLAATAGEHVESRPAPVNGNHDGPGIGGRIKRLFKPDQPAT